MSAKGHGWTKSRTFFFRAAYQLADEEASLYKADHGTCNEILCFHNKPDDFILAIVEFMGKNKHRVYCLTPKFVPAGT